MSPVTLAYLHLDKQVTDGMFASLNLTKQNHDGNENSKEKPDGGNT